MELAWAQHEVIKPPTEEEMLLLSPDELIEWFNYHNESVANAINDPYRYGHYIPRWKLVEDDLKECDEALILGGNRSAKTSFAARTVIKAALENPESTIFCFAQNAEVSIRQQQFAIYYWLPPELREKTTSTTTYISYTQKNGFSDSSLILPNKSHIIFKTYSQFQNDNTIIEGAELGSKMPKWINVGVWLDEYLLGNELIDTMRFRLATRNSKMLVTFTPVDGWTEVVREYLEGAKTTEWRNAPLLNGERVPYVQRSKKRGAAIHYFHSQDNPFGGYERIARDLANEPREKILIRAYGVPTKSYSSKFPKFSTAVNVVKAEAVPKDVTRYCIIDPGGRKNWFIAWVAVDASGTWWVYREWPGVNIGEWAENGKNGKWIPGPGAKGMGMGIRDYVDLIYTQEGREEDHEGNILVHGEDIFERLIDPRLGAAIYSAPDGESSIIQDMEDCDMSCIPAPGDRIEYGIQKLLDKMAYDMSREIDAANRPFFYITEDCENLIAAMGNYTGDDGKDEAWKDPIDCLRYAACADIDYFPAGASNVTREVGGY